ncbi:MAG: argininosuccinate lyase [bacterium]|nr:argininosuccinate lyase [bacterium]
MKAPNDASPLSSACRGCGEPQPTVNWQSQTGDKTLQEAWVQATSLERYCGVCGTPSCDDEMLDRLQGDALDDQAGRLYGTSLVSPTPEVVAFMAGWDVASKGAADQSLVLFDLWVNRAHTRMLVAQAILSPAQGQAILDGLETIEQHHHTGQFRLQAVLEDVHTNIEKYLTDELGITAALAIHTARSRNDQVVTDMRLWMRARVLNLAQLCLDLMHHLADVSRLHLDSVMVGYTHHQHATISTFGHHLAAYAEAIRRVVQRLHAWYDTFNYSPLGCVTGLSTTFPIDRYLTADLLGCAGPEPNALDPIASRWEPEADLAQILAILLNHLSSMAQTFILLSTQEFGVLKLHPRFCSGSSIMPQKVNPDALEVIKGKAAEVASRLNGLLSLGRATLTGYNRDQQWSKYLIMEACLEGLPAVSIMSRVVAHSCRPLQKNPCLQRDIGIDTRRLKDMAGTGFAGVTELMEQLVRQTGVELRRLKRAIERAVALSLQAGEQNRITSTALQQALQDEHVEITVDADTVQRLQDPTTILAAKQVVGGPGRQALETELAQLDDVVATQRQVWQARRDTLQAKYDQCR